jgi:hypothetical protein
MLFKRIFNFFDKVEDKTRHRLSHRPIRYAFIGGVGVILFWRGVWHSIDYVVEVIHHSTVPGLSGFSSVLIPWWDGPISFVLGTILLLVTGTFVSSFIGNEIIITGLSGEKKLTEKTDLEVRTEVAISKDLEREVREVAERLEELQK